MGEKIYVGGLCGGLDPRLCHRERLHTGARKVTGGNECMTEREGNHFPSLMFPARDLAVC